MSNNTNNNGNNKAKFTTWGTTNLASTAKLEWDTIPFPGFQSETVRSSKYFCEKISEKFREQFHDYHACNIDYSNPNRLSVVLYFINNPADVADGYIKNLESISCNKNMNNMTIRKQAIENINKGITFKLNDETKHLLSEFILNNGKEVTPKSPIWNSIISVKNRTVTLPNGGYQTVPWIGVTIDFTRVITKIFGTKTITNIRKDKNGEITGDEVTVAYKNARIIGIDPVNRGAMLISLDQIIVESMKEEYLKLNPSVTSPINNDIICY